MKSPTHRVRGSGRSWLAAVFAVVGVLPTVARASMFQGETLDKVADAMTWVVLVIAPVVAIGVFLLVHILPEKIAEKKQHPQTSAIQCLCLLSLFFGGMLWPIAWLWAYTKPVMHKLAYGTDKVPHGGSEVPALEGTAPEGAVKQASAEKDSAMKVDSKLPADEVNHLRKRIAELESRLAGAGANTEKV